jgi:hypothetical protein
MNAFSSMKPKPGSLKRWTKREFNWEIREKSQNIGITIKKRDCYYWPHRNTKTIKEYSNKLDNLDEKNKFLERQNY